MKWPGRSKLRKWSGWLLAALFVAVLGFWAFRPRSTPVELAGLERRVLIQSLVIEGKFQAVERHLVTAFSDGEIEQVTLKVGDRVEPGQELAWIQRDWRRIALRSPIRGVISKVERESAGPIRRGEPVLEVVDPDHTEFIVELLTPDASRVQIGSSALLEGAVSSGPIRAEVHRVSRAGFTKLSALGVEEERTEVALRAPGGGLFSVGDSFHADARIELGRSEDVPCIPVGAIFRSGEEIAAYVLREGRAELRTLEVGARNEDWVEVRSGLSEGERVVVYPGDLVRPGSRIKPIQKSRPPA